MEPVISSLLNTNSLLPHGFCINWTPALLWFYVIADALIALSYFTIPLTIAYFVWRKKDMLFSWVFILFASFISACGITHLLGIIVLWNPIYWIDASMKGVTAMISVATAIAMLRLVPKALNLPTYAQLNQEVQAKQQAYEALAVAQQSLLAANEYLEARVTERTRELHEKEEYLRVAATAFEAQEGMFITDINSIILRVNQAFTRITGYSAEETLGKTPRLFKSGRHDKKFYDAMWESINDTGSWTGEIWNRRKSGEVYPVEITITSVKDDFGIVTNYVATLTDITERKQVEWVINENNQRLNRILDNLFAYVALLDTNGIVQEINKAPLERTGYLREDAIGQYLYDAPWWNYDETIRTQLITAINAAKQGESSRYDVTVKMADDLVQIDFLIAPVRDSAGQIVGLLQTAVDITERKRLESELKRQAHIDYLTGLSNRHHFMAQGEVELSRAIRYDTPLSVMMLDIDYFKTVNDTYGHQVGDIVLRALSKICQDTLRQVDIAGRLGGEEFAVILPETTSAEAFEVAERLRKAVASTDVAIPVGLAIRFTVSIGVTTLEKKDINIDMLLNQADKALYVAKESGRNKVCVG